jgi:phage/plasmid-associated DNA primase
MGEAEAVRLATASYRASEDILGDFITDCCISEHGAAITKADMKTLYQTWCDTNKIEPIKQKEFKSRLTERGITEVQTSDGKKRTWRGIRGRSPMDDTDITAQMTQTLWTNGTESCQKSSVDRQNNQLSPNFP